MTAYQELAVEVSDPVATVVLGRAGRPATLTGRAVAELHRALDGAERAPRCRAVVLRGANGTFSTGMDLTEAAGESAPSSNGSTGAGAGAAYYDLLARFTASPRVIVCLVDGPARGGGVGLAAASDLVIATPRAEFSLPEALWGLLPCVVLPFLLRRVGFQAAYAMALRTQPVTAAQAERCRLVDEVTGEPDLLLRRLVGRLARVPASTVADLKRYLAALHPIPNGSRDLAVGELDRLLGSPQVRQAIRRYAESGTFPWQA